MLFFRDGTPGDVFVKFAGYGSKVKSFVVYYCIIYLIHYFQPNFKIQYIQL